MDILFSPAELGQHKTLRQFFCQKSPSALIVAFTTTRALLDFFLKLAEAMKFSCYT